MKIAIVAPSPVPFCIGGAEKLWWGLIKFVNEQTPHHVDLIKLPSREHSFWDLVDTYESFSKLNLSHFDLVISTKYPAWMVNHPNHVCYMQHRLRGLYDTYHFTRLPLKCSSPNPKIQALTGFMDRYKEDSTRLEQFFGHLHNLRNSSDIDKDVFAFPGPLARQVIHYLDGIGLAASRIRRYTAIAKNVAGRQDYFPEGVDVQVVHHPTHLTVSRKGSADYLFTVGRVDNAKRVRLMIEAMQHVKSRISLKIAGTGPDEPELRQLARSDERIEFLGFVNDDDVADYYADALAVLYIPYDEDYGMVTIEAMLNGKPVITTTDSGGPLEFVTDGETGFISDPSPTALAAKIDEAANNRRQVLAMADACRQRVGHISWESVVSSLLGEAPKARPASTIRKRETSVPKITMALTFPVYPPRGGGQARVFHLYRNLAPGFQVDVVSVADYGQPAFEGEVAPGVREIRIPKTLEHARKEWELSAQLDGVPVTDVVMPELYHLTPDYATALARSAADADILVACHPFLLPALEQVRNGQGLIYEAHDVEAVLKSSILPGNALGRHYVTLTEAIERRACESSDLIMACLEEDAKAFNRIYGSSLEDVSIVPNGVDLETVTFRTLQERQQLKRDKCQSDAFTVLFMGSWHGPNIEAVFCLMEIARSLPYIKFLVVGSVGSYLDHFGFMLPDNMESTGVVDDSVKDTILGTVDLAVNPMETGSGTNLKMLDYMAAGIPTLTTPFGARGLNIENGVTTHIAPLIAFPQVIERLRQASPGETAALIERARNHVVGQFSWRVIADRFAATLRGLYNTQDRTISMMSVSVNGESVRGGR